MAKITVTRKTLEKIITLTTITERVANAYNNRAGVIYYVCDIPFINNTHYVKHDKNGYYFTRHITVYCSSVEECLFEHFVNGHGWKDIHVTE